MQKSDAREAVERLEKFSRGRPMVYEGQPFNKDKRLKEDVRAVLKALANSKAGDAVQEATRDAKTLGTGWVQFNSDGSAERVDPSRIAIRVLPSGASFKAVDEGVRGESISERDQKIVKDWLLATRAHRGGSRLGKLLALRIADDLEAEGVTEADIYRLFPARTLATPETENNDDD